MGVPIIGCHCPVCTSDDPRNRRTRTSAFLRIHDQHILLDAGPDLRLQALAAQIDWIDAVLLTHSHFDHVAGLDDLRPLMFQRGPIPIHGTKQTLADIRRRFDYAFAESSDGSTRPAFDLQPIDGPFHVGDTEVQPFNILHGTWTITGFRIGRLGYVTDASKIPDASLPFLRDLDVLVLNALRYEPHPTHLSLEEALAIIADVRPQRAFLVHMNHALDHAAVNAQLPTGVELAYDGLHVEIAEIR